MGRNEAIASKLSGYAKFAIASYLAMTYVGMYLQRPYRSIVSPIAGNFKFRPALINFSRTWSLSIFITSKES
jgi:hypothetical protein